MKLSHLEIRRMPGFGLKGFSLSKLDRGIYVIFGTNGAGKTTTCKAIKALLWPNQNPLSPIALHSLWTGEHEEKIEIDLEGTSYKILPQNVKTKLLKSLPPATYAACYTIDNFDVADDQTFATEIAKQLKGGYDFNLIRSHPFFTIHKNQGKLEKTKLDKALWELRAIQTQEKAREQLEEKIEHLTLQIEVAKNAKEKIPFLQNALQYKAIEEELKTLTHRLQQFPSGLSQLLEQDQETYAQVVLKKNRLGIEISQLQHKINATQDTLNSFSHLSLPSVDAIKSLRNLLEQHRELSFAKKTHQQVLDNATKLLDKYLAFIRTEENLYAEIELEKIVYLQQQAQRYQQIKAKLEIVDTKWHLLATNSPLYKHTIIRKGIALLNQWLESNQRSFKIRQMLGLFLSLGVCAWQAYLELPWETLAVSSLVPLLWLWKQPYSVKNKLKKAYLQLELPVPTLWATQQVHQLLEFLESEWEQGIRFHEETSLRQTILREKEELDQQWLEIQASLADFPFGFDETTATSSPLFFEQIKNILQTQVDVEKATEKNTLLTIELDKLNQQIQVALGAITSEQGQPAILFEKITEEIAQIKAHQQQLEQTQRQLEYTQKEFHQLIEYLEALFKRAECTEDEQLNHLFQLMPEFQSIKKMHLAKQIEIDFLKTKLEKYPELMQPSFSELQTALDEAYNLSRTLETHLEQKTAHKHEQQIAQNAFHLEKNEIQANICQEALETTFEEFQLALFGQFLLDTVESEYQKESEPIVYTYANEWFAKFTHHKYTLLPPSQKNSSFAFMALDTCQQEIKEIQELSQGTKTQLLLAVRLAFTLFIEKDRLQLPLFLDETLNSCDAARFQEIVKVLFEIAKTGRQIFYFTCHDTDVERWQWMAAQFPEVPFASIPLTPKPALPLPQISVESIPKPLEGQSLHSYANAFAISPLDLNIGLGHVSIYYLVETALEFYYLKSLKIETYGQLKPLLAEPQRQEHLKKVIDWPKMQIKGALLEAFFNLWKIGKGKKIDAEVLQRAGITEKYMGPILETAKEINYDAVRLLELLEEKSDERLKGFRQHVLAKLKNLFLEEGYLDPRPPVQPEDFQINLLKTVAPNEILHLDETLIFIQKLQASLCT